MKAPEPHGDARPLLCAQDLSISSGDRLILAPSSFTTYEGERVLMVGPSGSGKSLFLDLLLGFAERGRRDLRVSGRLTLDGQDLRVSPPGAERAIGAVFQLHALGLFDDFSALQNLRFGDRSVARCEKVALDLGLTNLERPVTTCSGGERVRVALARTLLHGAEVLLYDEPTTGLDPAAASLVLSCISRSHRRLSLVVTHDATLFDGFADAVLEIDPEGRCIRRRGQTLPTAARTGAPAPSAWRLALGRLDRFVSALGAFGFDLLALLCLPWGWLRILDPLDGPRLRVTLARHVSPSVGIFTLLSALLVALTATYFLFARLPLRPYTEPLLQDDLLAGLGLILVRVAIPLVVSVLLAAKLGATASAHLGHMSLTRQVDALRLLGVSPRRHLLLPTGSGLLGAALLFTALSEILALLTATAVFLAMHPGYSARYGGGSLGSV